MPLFRLIYLSSSTVEVDLELLASILNDSEVNNKKLELTGMLLATNKHFLQVLEGNREAVNRVYKNISNDKRHKDITLISYQTILQREFKTWSMKAVSLNDVGKGLTQMLRDKYGQEDEDFKFPLDPCKAFSLFLDVMYYLKK